jgi:hypothetical protein
MEYRGIEYAVHAGIATNRWVWMIYTTPSNPLRGEIAGSKESAELDARLVIDKWLAKQAPAGGE